MKSLAALPLVALSTAAFAHPSHVAEQAGHSHWIALAAAMAAVAIAVIGIARGFSRRRRSRPAND